VTPIPIDPSIAISPSELSVGGVTASPTPEVGASGPAGGGEGFGSMLAEQISNLEQLQTQGAEASRALATGTAQDLPSVVAAVERARLSMELASQVRTRAVEAYQEIFRTQV
jgi:flagellar hook-basal body complex protein FliE